jgi:hypothetical protein
VHLFRNVSNLYNTSCQRSRYGRSTLRSRICHLILITKSLRLQPIVLSVQHTDVPLVLQACKVLLKCLVTWLAHNEDPPRTSDHSIQSSKDGHGASSISTTGRFATVSPNEILLALDALCSGDSTLTHSMQLSLVAALRSASPPSVCAKPGTSKFKNTMNLKELHLCC